MGDYKLNTHVHAVEVDAAGVRTGREGVFGPDSDLSTPENEWALAAISNPDVWADGKVPDRKPAPPAHEDDEVAKLRARIAELEAEKAAKSEAADVPAEPKTDDKPAVARRPASNK